MQISHLSNKILKKENNDTWVYALTLFFLFPFGLLFYSFNNIKEYWAKNAFWAFITYFGFTFVIISEGNDAYQYWLDLNNMYYDRTTVSEFFSTFYSTHSGIDIFQPLITYLVSFFTNSSKVLFAVFGFVFGYFYSRIIWLLMKLNEYKLDINISILIFCCALVIPFWFIGGVRFWTASIIYIYAILHYIFSARKNKYLLLIILTPLVHFSFFLPATIFGIYYLFGNRLYVYYLLFIMTIFVSELDITYFSDLATSYFPELLKERVTGYLNEDYATSVKENSLSLNWYVNLYINLLTWFNRVIISLIFFYLAKKKNIPLLSFSLLFSAFANILITVPSGSRFLTISNMFLLATIIILYKRFNTRIKKIIIVGFPVLLFFCLVSVRLGFDSMSPFLFIGNPIISTFLENNFAIIDLIK